MISDILHSEKKVCMDLPGTGLLDNPPRFGSGVINDGLSFGFSYIEQEDHLVKYIIAGPSVIKRIFAEIPDSEVMEGNPIGRLWTANLYVSKKVKDGHIVFSNENFGAVIDLNINIE